MKNCNEIKKFIAELSNNQTIENQDILQHIENCQSCKDYQNSCDVMNDAFVGMNDFDADEALVESTLSSILNLQEQTHKPSRRLNTQWASALAASFMLVSLIALFPYNSISDYGLTSSTPESIDQISPQEDKKERRFKKKRSKETGIDFFEAELADEVVTRYRKIPSKSTLNQNMSIKPELLQSQGLASAMEVQPRAEDDSKELMDKLSKKIGQDMKEELSQSIADHSYKSTRSSRTKWQEKPNEMKSNNLPLLESDGGACCDDDQDKVELERVITTGSRIRAEDLEAPTPVYSIDRESTEKDGKEKFNVAMGTASDKGSVFFNAQYTRVDEQNHHISNGSNSVYHISKDDLRVNPNKTNRLEYRNKKPGLKSDDLLGKQKRAEFEDTSDKALAQTFEEEEQKQTAEKALNPAELYLNEINSLQNITYQKATGYWANSYVPGDSKMRLLQTSLMQNNTLDLNNNISQNLQPFDYPEKNALAVYLSSDHAFVESSQPTRMRLQVGIQAANRKGGHRSAMNIGLVFDLSNRDNTYAKKMKALLMALLRSKQPGDNISLTTAGVHGGVLIEPKDFRQGSIQVALNKLFSEKEKTDKSNRIFSLQQAMQATTTILQKNDDATASLGSSVIMLFSSNQLNKNTKIETLVHNNALSGITLSTISMSPINQEMLNELALIGQGHARILQSSDDAKRVIDAELLASSRAVARALRLRIRLAKGVKLIEVLDSYNLNDLQAQRVRDAEQSLDKRLSKNLGITADRGDDEEGIQIVIPSFFAGDTHVILLDIVVSNPGALTDVALRYKDLLYLRNAITRKQLNLEGNPKQLGPLQLNVMKNVLAHRFSDQIKQASSLLRQGKSKAALSELLKTQELYHSMRAQFPSWNADVEILKDQQLIQQYINLLNANAITDAKQLNYIADSMQYISWRKNITKTD